jgi:hypothetical protein
VPYSIHAVTGTATRIPLIYALPSTSTVVLGDNASMEVSVTVGTAERTPVPVIWIICGLPTASSVIVTVPVEATAFVGV